MTNNLFKEIKFRCLFIFLNWIGFINLLYFYKEILFFLILKKLNYIDNFESYLVYTNITELFSIYIKLINFCNLQMNLSFICYHSIIFCIPAFYKKEFKNIINIFVLIIFFNSLYFILFSKLFPFLIDFLKNFQEPYMYFEIKVNEIFSFLLKIFIQFQFLFISILLLFFFLIL